MDLLTLVGAGLLALAVSGDPQPTPEPNTPPAAQPPVQLATPTVIIDGVKVCPPATRGTTVGNTIVVDNAGRGGTVIIDGNKVVAPAADTAPSGRTACVRALGDAGGVTVISGSGYGPGSRVIVDNGRPAVAPEVPAEKCYQGKENGFWTRRLWSDDFGCMIYWDPATLKWYRYNAASDSYRAVNWLELIDE